MNDFKSSAKKYSSYDLLKDFATYPNRTHKGITFTWSGDECFISGTNDGTGLSICNLYYNTQALPSKIIPGREYYLMLSWSEESPRPFVRIYFYGAGETLLFNAQCRKNTKILVPSTAVGCIIRIEVSSGTAITETVKLLQVALLENMPNNLIWDYEIRTTAEHDGVFASDDDLDNYTVLGAYRCETVKIAQSLLHSPFYGNGEVIRLFVIAVSTIDQVLAQVVITNKGHVAIRNKAGANSAWGEWRKNDLTETNITALILAASDWTRGELSRTAFTADSSSAYAASDYLSVSPNDYVRLMNCMSSREYAICYFYDDSHNFIALDSRANHLSTYNDVLIIVPQNAAYMRVMCRYANAESAKVDLISGRKIVIPTDKSMAYLERFIANVGSYDTAPFVQVKASHPPIIALIDDDTRSVTQVKDFFKICNDNSIPGTSAAITSFLNADANIVTALKGGEKQGHQTVFHCYEQAGNTIWINPDEHVSEVIENVARGIHDMEQYGFANWRDWVTPAGTTKKLIVTLARRFGMRTITSITQNDYLGYDNLWGRYCIPRMELYPDDEGHVKGQTLAGIKAKIDECVSVNGFLLVGIHTHIRQRNTAVITLAQKGGITRTMNRMEMLIGIAERIPDLRKDSPAYMK